MQLSAQIECSFSAGVEAVRPMLRTLVDAGSRQGCGASVTYLFITSLDPAWTTLLQDLSSVVAEQWADDGTSDASASEDDLDGDSKGSDATSDSDEGESVAPSRSGKERGGKGRSASGTASSGAGAQPLFFLDNAGNDATRTKLDIVPEDKSENEDEEDEEDEEEPAQPRRSVRHAQSAAKVKGTKRVRGGKDNSGSADGKRTKKPAKRYMD